MTTQFRHTLCMFFTGLALCLISTGCGEKKPKEPAKSTSSAKKKTTSKKAVSKKKAADKKARGKKVSDSKRSATKTAPAKVSSGEPTPTAARPDKPAAGKPAAVKPAAGKPAAGGLGPRIDRKAERTKRFADRRGQAKARRDERLKKMAKGPRTDASATPPSVSAKSRGPKTLSLTGRPSATTAQPSARPSLQVRDYLPLSDARSISKNKRLNNLGSLPGIKATLSYNSAYYAPPKRSQFGVAIQVWKERTIGGVNERFNRMKRDYPNVEQHQLVAKGSDREFFSSWNTIMSVSIALRKKRTILTISCGTKVCTPEELYEMAKKAYVRL